MIAKHFVREEVFESVLRNPASTELERFSLCKGGLA